MLSFCPYSKNVIGDSMIQDESVFYFWYDELSLNNHIIFNQWHTLAKPESISWSIPELWDVFIS